MNPNNNTRFCSRTSLYAAIHYYVIIFSIDSWTSCLILQLRPFNLFLIYYTFQFLFFVGYFSYITGDIFDYTLLFAFPLNVFLPSLRSGVFQLRHEINK